MATTTFIANSANQQANWDDPARWTGGVAPNDPNLDVIIPTTTVVATGQPYVSNISASGTHAVGSLTISNNNLGTSGTFAVSHNLDVGANSSFNTAGSVTAASIDNKGVIFGQGGHITVTGQFLNKMQLSGNLLVTAASFTNTGTLSTTGLNTLVVSHGGFTNLSGSTLSGGTYQAGDEIFTGFFRTYDLYLNVGAVISTDAATISLGRGGTIYSYDDVSQSYVSFQSSVHSIAAAGKLSLANSGFAWTDLTVDGQVTLTGATLNATQLTVNGLVTLTRSTLNATQLTIDAGGIVSGAGALGGPILNNGTIIAKTLDNSALGNGLTINGAVSGSGTVELFTSNRLEIAAAFSNTVAFDNGQGVLTLDDYTHFTGKIRPAATGDAIILKGVSYSSVTSYSYSGDNHQGTLAILTAGGEIDLTFLGNFNTGTFHLMAGPKVLSSDPDTLEIDTGASAPTVLAPVEANSGARLITQAELLADFVGPSPVASGLAISSGLGTLVDNHNGTWSYTPAHDDSSAVAFSYQVNFTNGSAAETATLDIVPVTFHFEQATFPLADFAPAQGWGSQNQYPREVADVNGDGLADIIGFGSDGVLVSLATGSGHFASPAVGIANFAFNPGAGGWTSENQYPRQMADVNGDGMADIVGFGANEVAVSLATGGGHFASPVLGIQNFAFNPVGGGWTSQDQYPRFLADVNGDGMADIVGFGANEVAVSLATGGGHFASPVLGIQNFAFNPVGGGWTSENQYPRLLADVNGDGMADIVGFGANEVAVSLATGGGHFASPVLGIQNFAFNPVGGGWTSQDQYPRLLADVNGDGMADIVGFGADSTIVSLATGGGHFASPVLGSANFAVNAGGWVSQNLFPRALGDVDGDHAADIIGFGHDGVFAALSNGFHII